MNINLVIITEKTQKFYDDARKEYEKRLGRFCKLKVICAKNLEKSKKSINQKIPTVIIDNLGLAISSEEVAEKISLSENKGISSVNIVVGDNILFGDDNSLRLSVTQFEISADLTAVIVLEQIYRAYKIICGETYHK